ncbi:LysR family transcriptional regulator [Xylophilus rhododendri]|uniref:LysR family transcriptional regulator n=1 Tax=Xylophilus rhododendri TaxID=2697032 RepID=A0A857JCJ8_9BURK|nr:LysR family transcriptional regulator [Xylophilus rhododendri]QHJ00830.1 LysR family transcriptional regulator [Xylophilus rhododendri]
MQSARDVLTPDTLSLLQAIAREGSFAAAARSLGLVPSALTYRVRQVEDALDALLFDRSSRQARLTAAGTELLREGARLLDEIDAVANRVRRVATGWEPQLTIAVDGLIERVTVMELTEAFFGQAPPTQLKLRDEILTGTLQALNLGQADLAIGVNVDMANSSSLNFRPLGSVEFIYVVAPHHPLAEVSGLLSDAHLRAHRAVAVADTVQRGDAATVGLFAGQEVLTVPSMQAKLDAQLRGLGAGAIPAPLARPFVSSGRLVEKKLDRPPRIYHVGYAWRGNSPGRALQWWLQQLESPATRAALLDRPRQPEALA